jgi:hypothetical protein
MLMHIRFLKPFTTKLTRLTTLLEKCFDLLLYGHLSIIALVCMCTNSPFYYTSHSTRAIHTYGGRGTTVTHAPTGHHVVIHTGDQPPPLIEGESERIYDRPPIQVVLDPKGEPLHTASRLNVAKIITIDHDIPISRLGKISIRDVERLRQYSGVSISTRTLDDLDEDEDEDDAYR